MAHSETSLVTFTLNHRELLHGDAEAALDHHLEERLVVAVLVKAVSRAVP
jgi:hypothetical protein